MGYGRHSPGPSCHCTGHCCFTAAHPGQAPDTIFVLHQSKEILFSYCASLRSQPHRSINLHYQCLVPGCACQVNPSALLMCLECWNPEMNTTWASANRLVVECSYVGNWLVTRVGLLWKMTCVLEAHGNIRVTIW